jgi:hypothetical protein
LSLENWIRAYNKQEKETIELIKSNGEPMFDDPKFSNTYVEKIPIMMERKSVFYELSFWDHIKITQLLDPMHILKNVSSSLCRKISLKKSDALGDRRDFIS